MYKPEGFAEDIFRKRYTLGENETWQEACERVARHVATAESVNSVEFFSQFSDLLKKNLFMPGGRIWYGSGRPKGQLLNCFVAPTVDSREGWGKTLYDEVVICGTGGGLGINFSPIRPRGSDINGHSGKATGAVSLMEIVDAAGSTLKAGGGRRTALMFCLGLSHGDILEFMDKKLDLDKLNNANVSVVFDENPEIFFEAVKSDTQMELRHAGRVLRKVSARDVWEKIVKNALRSGEPGLLNGYLANKMSNIWYHAPLISTNPCGEIWLTAYDCCCLGAMVLPRFVRDGQLNREELAEAVKLSVRFLDDVLTINNYPLPEIKETCSNIRRIGLGVMGLHDMLLLMGLKYNSDQGLEQIDSVMGFIKNRAYEASVELAKEKGPFLKFDPDHYLKSGFVKTLKPTLRSAIRENGIRNCALLTIAPTGTTSIVSAVTSGIEPMFAPAYHRKFRDGDKLATEIVIHPMLKRFLDEGKDVAHFQGAFDLKLRDHFEVQRVCQRHLDNACSKTINVPQGTSEEDLSSLYMEFFHELKGVTVYPDGSRADQPLTPMSLQDAIAHVKEAKVDIEDDPCKSGICSI